MPEILQTLQSNDFAKHIGKYCLIERGEEHIRTVVADVFDKPKARHPRAAADSRTPFVLLLRGEPDCQWSDGIYTLKVDGMERIPGVFVNRIVNVDLEPASYFQVVFN